MIWLFIDTKKKEGQRSGQELELYHVPVSLLLHDVLFTFGRVAQDRILLQICPLAFELCEYDCLFNFLFCPSV